MPNESFDPEAVLSEEAESDFAEMHFRDDHFDADTKSRGIIALVCLVAMLAFNYAVAPVVVFSLVKIKTDLVYAVPVVVTVAAWAVF